MRHVMLDLETWGTEPGCDIRSIGAVVFHPDNGTIARSAAFYRNVDGGEEIRGLKRDPSTIEWWEGQSAEARAAFTDPVDLHEGLRDFSEWYAALGEPAEITFWCNGPHFDEVILKACYNACNLPVPWHYRAPRDFRTEMEGAGWPDVEFMGTAHNALDDAIHQARCVIRARQIRPAVVA